MCFHMRLTLEHGVSGLEKMKDQVKMRKTYKIMENMGDRLSLFIKFQNIQVMEYPLKLKGVILDLIPWTVSL